MYYDGGHSSRRYIHAPDNELLLEAVPETLKNMLLVMSTSGAFEGREGAGGQSLAAVTRAVLVGFCPELCAPGTDLAQLWGDEAGGAPPPPPPAAAAVAETEHDSTHDAAEVVVVEAAEAEEAAAEEQAAAASEGAAVEAS